MIDRRTQGSTLRALAADLDDVLLRWHGHPEDAETVREVSDSLITMANNVDPKNADEYRRGKRMTTEITDIATRIGFDVLRWATIVDDEDDLRTPIEVAEHFAEIVQNSSIPEAAYEVRHGMENA